MTPLWVREPDADPHRDIHDIGYFIGHTESHSNAFNNFDRDRAQRHCLQKYPTLKGDVKLEVQSIVPPCPLQSPALASGQPPVGPHFPPFIFCFFFQKVF